MPDFKYWDPTLSSRLMKARDYPDVARAAIREMHRQVGDLELDDEGIARRGLLVRHLVMPDALEETESILRWLSEEISPDTYVNVMDQYHPDGRVLREPGRYPSLERRLRRDEHARALDLAREVGLTRIDVRRPHPKLRRLAFF